jgi:hypothetical protein
MWQTRHRIVCFEIHKLIYILNMEELAQQWKQTVVVIDGGIAGFFLGARGE